MAGVAGLNDLGLGSRPKSCAVLEDWADTRGVQLDFRGDDTGYSEMDITGSGADADVGAGPRLVTRKWSNSATKDSQRG